VIQPARTPVGYAHRGFSPDGAENTMRAFQAAVDLGYRHLETDARATADGMAVAFHDHLLDRLTNHIGPLRALTWQQVAQARVGGGEKIPLLEDVLAGFGEVTVNIDVKSDAAIGPTLDAIRRTGSWRRVRLAAFSHRRLLGLRRAAGPAVASSLSPPEVAALAAGRRSPAPVGMTGGLAAQVPVRIGRLNVITTRLILRAHARGIEVHAWTVNDQPEMRRLLDLGVDAIVSDRADLLRDVLVERGQWPG
jgi:glycerophosphoryl diester phosphodiesterase